jgi:hypothetical protein
MFQFELLAQTVPVMLRMPFLEGTDSAHMQRGTQNAGSSSKDLVGCGLQPGSALAVQFWDQSLTSEVPISLKVFAVS